jgi:hypothetical protein
MPGIEEFGSTELIAEGVIGELAAAARRHNVMISITVTPYDPDEEEGNSAGAPVTAEQ